MTFPPRYTPFDLRIILESEVQPPPSLNAEHFLNDIKYNRKIKWKVNSFLFRKKLLLLLFETSIVKKWRILKSFNWLLALLIIAFAMRTGDYKIIIFFIIFPLLIITVDHWMFIFNLTVVIGLKFLFKLSISYFWFFVTTVMIGYVLNKAINEMIEKKILKQALSDWTTFWLYYSNTMIWMEQSAFNDEYEFLTDKYPELRSL